MISMRLVQRRRDLRITISEFILEVCYVTDCFCFVGDFYFSAFGG